MTSGKSSKTSSRKKRERRGITVRVMWMTGSEEEEGKRVAEALKETLREMGYEVRSSTLPNREGSGGRIYINIRRRSP